MHNETLTPSLQDPLIMSTNGDTQKDLPENQGQSQETFQQLIQSAMRSNWQSDRIFQEVHLPELSPHSQGVNDNKKFLGRYMEIVQRKMSLLSTFSSKVNQPTLTATPPIDVVLIGDSIVQRLKTVGASTRLAQLPHSFNAGAGGDRIENVLYRLSHLSPLLENRSIKVWVVMVGTNNLRRGGLPHSDISLYRLLLQALLRIEAGSKILACEIFKRRDGYVEDVEDTNSMLKAMITEMNANLGLQEDRITWCEAPAELTKEQLVDHVHLSEEGYRIWDDALYPKVQQLTGTQIN